MTDRDKAWPKLGPAAEAARAERETRRAAALRANLRRRKAQERGREQDQPAGEDPSADNLFQRISD